MPVPLTSGISCVACYRRLVELNASGWCHLVAAAGFPTSNVDYEQCLQEFAEQLVGYANEGLFNIVGGCSGTFPARLQQLSEELRESQPPSQSQGHRRAACAAATHLLRESPWSSGFV